MNQIFEISPNQIIGWNHIIASSDPIFQLNHKIESSDRITRSNHQIEAYSGKRERALIEGADDCALLAVASFGGVQLLVRTTYLDALPQPLKALLADLSIAKIVVGWSMEG